MSYQKTYHTSVTVSGTVSYPASQTSGYVSYSKTEPIDITINVDTRPFDNSVDNCNLSLDGLGGTVVGASAAECAAINKTADEVSTTLLKGFFASVNSELSQQIQMLDSKIKSNLMLLQQQNEAVLNQKNVMEIDFNRLSSRYANLFKDLDAECHKRIYALDKQAFNLAEKSADGFLRDFATDEKAHALIGSSEDSGTKLMLSLSSMNRKAQDVLDTVRNYINQEGRLNSAIESFQYEEKISENQIIFIPALFSESISVEGGDATNAVFIPEGLANAGAITEKLSHVGSEAPAAAWVAMPAGERERVNAEFNTLAEKTFSQEADARVYGVLMDLWKKSEPAVLSQ